MPNLAASQPLLEQWLSLLEKPVGEIENRILHDPDHQLIQCSPLGALITSRERLAVYRRRTRP
jgi:hypothetical protein